VKGIYIALLSVIGLIVLVGLGFLGVAILMPSYTIQSPQSLSINKPSSAAPTNYYAPKQATNPSRGGYYGVKQYNIQITGMAFSPDRIVVKAGDIVTFTNLDSVPHTITSDTGSELNSVNLAKGQTYSHMFKAPGTYYYHCSIRPSLQATVVVQVKSSVDG
jgi:plastocyanin